MVEKSVAKMPKVSRTVFKIRDSELGLFSSGGYYPHWDKNGKEWARLSEVRSHLMMLERGSRYHPKFKVPKSWEVVEIEVSEREQSCISAHSTLKMVKS